MSGPINVSAGFAFGAVVGVIVGFAWSQGTKSAISRNTTTQIGGGKAVITVDYMQAAKEGLSQALSR